MDLVLYRWVGSGPDGCFMSIRKEIEEFRRCCEMVLILPFPNPQDPLNEEERIILQTYSMRILHKFYL